MAFMVVMAVPTAAASARREAVLWLPCQPGLQFLQLLESPSSLLTHPLPTLDSTNSMHSKTIGVTNMMNSNTKIYLEK